MGSPNNETNHKPIEPLHVVRITRPFAVLDREITRAEVNAYGLTLTADDRTSPTPEHSMGGPSWYDAVGFCRWLGQCRELAEEDQVYPDSTTSGGRTNQAGSPFVEPDSSEWTARWDRTGFRLPSEAEWEIACRGGMRTAHGFGGDSALLGRYAWFEENSGRKGHVPRLLRPNLRGLFDTHGNIWEWCHDWIDYYPTDVAQDPVGPLRGSARVCRGGSWVNYLSECRSADRNATNPASRSGDIGFRVAVTCATHVEVDRF
jgi:formylglycine-generating enzyme required for sulfatase activity